MRRMILTSVEEEWKLYLFVGDDQPHQVTIRTRKMASTLVRTLEILIIYLQLTLRISCAEKNLIQAHVLYRHGDRSPVNIFPTDKHRSFWPDGPGRLTQKGMRMEYELGKFLRNRYINDGKFLNTSYLHKQVYCKSSDSERCLMSAESQMAGLFPPSGWQVWNKNISWQPIPVHTVPGDKDPLLRPWDAKCKRLNELKSEKEQQREYLDMQRKQKDFLHKLEIDTGLSSLKLTNIWSIRDTLFVEKSHNLSWPKWVTDDVWNTMDFLYFWGFKFMYTGEDEFSRLSGGPLIAWIVENMDAKIKESYPTFKLNIYSAHDTTILALLGSLGLYNATDIPYASAVLLELYKESGKYFVEMYYRNSTLIRPYQLHLRNCDKQCSFEQFISILQNRLPKDYEKECGNSKATKTVKNYMSLVIGLAIVSGVLLLVIIAILIQHTDERRKARKGGYLIGSNEHNEDGSNDNLLSI